MCFSVDCCFGFSHVIAISELVAQLKINDVNNRLLCSHWRWLKKHLLSNHWCFFISNLTDFFFLCKRIYFMDILIKVSFIYSYVKLLIWKTKLKQNLKKKAVFLSFNLCLTVSVMLDSISYLFISISILTKLKENRK